MASLLTLAQSRAVAPPGRNERALMSLGLMPVQLWHGIDDDLSYSWEPRKKEPKQEGADKALEPYSKTALTPTKPEAVAPPSNMPFAKPVGTTDVFMDDYIQVGQGGPRRMRKLRRHLLEAVDRVLAH
jgi:hypothetical protein